MDEHASSPLRRRLRVRGIVQGVGFRPHVYGLANSLRLTGFVLNDGNGALIEIEGSRDAVTRFEHALRTAAPPLARITSVDTEDMAPAGATDFEIRESGAGARQTFVSSDVATCSRCLEEISDPTARRYRYPFTNCTDCGPRFTITRDVPYDRPNTTMGTFPMCPDCACEYGDPADRRFHAQPIACPACGPSVELLDRNGHRLPGDPIREAGRTLVEGFVLAVKGLGGYHLACDATDETAVATLRARKHREDKPFALMAADLQTVGSFATIDPGADALLTSPRRPIVVLERRGEQVAEAVAPGNRSLGFMLPSTPLHHLLVAAFCDAGGRGVLVCTSGNVSDEPIAFRDEEARERLRPIADLFLLHDREIHIRCDDSVLRVRRGEPYLVRRARGYAPEPLRLATPLPRPVLAVGAELKHTFCVAKGEWAFVSHHIGDLENWETMRSFLEGIEHFCRIFDIRPEAVAYDPHPEYLSTKWALEQLGGHAEPLPGVPLEGLPGVAVQHHHAHIASCLAEHGLVGPVIGLACDGTGWGPDGTIWGGEVLVATLAGYQRVGRLRPIPLFGGAAAIRAPWRVAVAYLQAAYGEEAAHLPLSFVERTVDRWQPLIAAAEAGIRTIPASSTGRLFDAVAALCGIRDHVNYEGQAAIELEQAADPASDATYPCPLASDAEGFLIDWVPLIQAVVQDLCRNVPVPMIAARFHAGLARGLLEACRRAREATGLTTVVLTGGSFQNVLLGEQTERALRTNGFDVLVHRQIPPNDAGIAFGQLAVAGTRAAEGLPAVS